MRAICRVYLHTHSTVSQTTTTTTTTHQHTTHKTQHTTITIATHNNNKSNNSNNRNNSSNDQARQVCVRDLLLKPSGRHVGAWRPRTRCSLEAPSAPSSDALAARAAHAAVREPQQAEQLVGVPTIVSFLELNVDIPVVGGWSWWRSSRFSPGQSSSKRTANKIAEIPVPSGGPQDFPQTPHRAGDSSDFPDDANQWVFRTFPRNNKVRRSRALGAQSSSWTP